MQEYYKILGLTEDAAIEEIEKAYKEKKEKYMRERFYEGEIGNLAAKNLTKLETAYQEIINYKKHVKIGEKGVEQDFSEVEQLLKEGDVAKAQQKLDDILDRNAEWHYLQSVIFYKKNWSNESKKQLEIALNMEPHNTKYANAYTKLKEKMAFNDRQFQTGNDNYSNQQENANQRQMGGIEDSCCSFCGTWCCLNMMCNMCCR